MRIHNRNGQNVKFEQDPIEIGRENVQISRKCTNLMKVGYEILKRRQYLRVTKL